MTRRTKEQILEDEQFTCSNKKCKKIVEEIYVFTSYHTQAKIEGIDSVPLCEECFLKKESEFKTFL
jgi:hypothetical protein